MSAITTQNLLIVLLTTIILALIILEIPSGYLLIMSLLFVTLAVIESPEESGLEALKKAEERYRLLAETARVYIHHFTPEGIVTYMNKFAEEISGYSREEVIGKNFIDIFVPEDNKENVLRDLGPVMAGEEVVNYEAPMLTKSGEVKIMLWSGGRMVCPDGRVLGIVASGIDITELKRIEKELRESREQYRKLIEYSPIAMVVVQEGSILLANGQAEELSGYTTEEMRAVGVEKLIHPDDREYIESVSLALLDESPLRQPMEFRIVSKSGDILTVHGRGIKITYDGRPAILATLINVTELKRTQEALQESEQLYRTLVDHSLAGIFIVQGSRFVFANKRAEEISGYTFEEVKDLDFWELVHPENRQMVIDRASRRLKGEDIPEHYDYRMVNKNGEIRDIEIRASMINYQGAPAILANVIDITERKKAEEERLQVQKELEAHKRRFYKEAISALTQGKLEVLEPDDIPSFVASPRITVEVDEPKDVSLARHMVRQLAEENGLKGESLDDFILAVGEATMNSLKHAGSGTVLAGTRDRLVWTAVVDSGPGMDTFVLTQAALRKGFSTKPSLGFGYTFIISGSDCVRLSTTPNGTTVVMEKKIDGCEEPFPVNLARIPDLW